MKHFIYFLILTIPILFFNTCAKETTATCSDGIQNGNESGIDCGGDCTDCISCFDGIQNGDETGIDCGASCGVGCPIETNCNGSVDCMQAAVDGFYWEALGFEIELTNEHLQVSGLNLTAGVNTSVNLFFPNPSSSNLPMTIQLDDHPNEELVTIVKLIEFSGELRTYTGTNGAITLETFDEFNKTATGVFDVTGTGIGALGNVATSIVWNGKFNVTW